MRKKPRLLSRKLIVLFTVSVLISSLTVGIIGYFMNRNDSIRMNSERALGIARSVAAAVDTEEFESIVASGEKNEYWHEYVGMLDDVITRNQLAFLYVLHDYNDEDVIYFAEGLTEGDPVASLDFNETEIIDNYDENIADVFDGQEVISSDIYGANEWGFMVSGMAPIFNADGEVVGIVGADIYIDEVIDSVNMFGMLSLIIAVGISALLGTVMYVFLRNSLGRPIAELTSVSKKIADGVVDIEIGTSSNDEIGMLADSFRDMVENIRQQTVTLKAIAEGDLSVTVTPKSEDDIINNAFVNMIARLNDMISQINSLTSQVAVESTQIASSASSLAKGVSSQASAIEQLSASITEITIQTKQNADLADQSADLNLKMNEDATGSFSQMEKLITAVNDISEASRSVSAVLKFIEDIAFQTGILSLNASVEAAHAGDLGNGFSVISKEIQNLSKKTSESAKETAELIGDTIAKAELGVALANEAHDAMVNVVAHVKSSNRVSGEIALSSKEQMIAIEQVNKGINQVAGVIHQNSAVAEESASSSRNMNRQANDLTALISSFKTKDSAKKDT